MQRECRFDAHFAPGGNTMDHTTKAQRQTKRQQEDAILNRVLILFVCAVAVEALLLLLNHFLPGSAVLHWLTILVPVAAVLAMVYYLFQRDFFCIALISAGGIFSLQLYRKMFAAHPFRIRCGFVLGLVLLAAAAVVFFLFQCKKSALPRQVQRFLSKDTSYPLLYITCALNALLLILTLALGSTAAYYLLFVLVGWLFVMAVYYVVKLM